MAVAHVKALEYLESAGNTLISKTIACNIGTGNGTSVTQLLEMAEEVAKRKVPHTIGARRDGDPVSVYADATLARKVLNWQSTHDLRSIIESAYNWHSTHPSGYR